MRSLPLAVCSLLLLFASADAFAQVPAQGNATEFEIATWNIEWFGSTSNGPSDEALQMSNVVDVISGADLDLWGVEEIISSTTFDDLVNQLSGYSGLLVSDASVTNGSAYYHSSEQKVGIIYKTAHFSVTSAQVILTAYNYEFAGRPPLEVTGTVSINGTTQDLVVIVMHMKAFNDQTSWQRRRDASIALKNYLDTTYPTQWVAVIGDWNDDVDTSITSGQDTPFRNFLDDPADYTFVTEPLTIAGVSSTTSYSDMIDHQLVTNEPYNNAFIAGSADVFELEPYIANYDATTSDHYPVFSRYNIGGGPPTPSVTVTAPNGGETWHTGATETITWTSTVITDVEIEYTLDGSNWTQIVASTPASAGSYAWTLPTTTSSTARVRVSDTGGAVSDESNADFTIADPPAGPTTAWINEIHYDNSGTDTGEGVEIAGTAGTNLSGWQIVGYNGNGNSVYKTVNLSGTIPNQQAGFGTVWFAISSLQNGAPDGIALVDDGGAVVQFLSYEGTLTAADGPAAGLTSTDIGVAEDSGTPAGHSLQLTGTGSAYADFAWQAPATDSPGAVNSGQTFEGTGGPATAWINEIHYDNSGGDKNEGVEIAGTAGLDLSGWQLVGYNGNGGSSYTTVNLGGTLPDQEGGFGTDWYAISGLQNGAPDGIALVDDGGAVVQFLSYEGSFTAADGPASGMTSTDIGVSENSGTNKNHSLQLGGTGSSYADFTWEAPQSHTRGDVNQNQTFSASKGGHAAVATAETPGAFELSAAYPNPFNPQTQFSLRLTEAAPVRVAVYDLLGREVALLHDAALPAGTHRFTFEAAHLPSGLYLYRAAGGGHVATGRMVLLK